MNFSWPLSIVFPLSMESGGASCCRDGNRGEVEATRHARVSDALAEEYPTTGQKVPSRKEGGGGGGGGFGTRERLRSTMRPTHIMGWGHPTDILFVQRDKNRPAFPRSSVDCATLGQVLAILLGRRASTLRKLSYLW